MLTPDARIETTKYYRQGGQTSNVDDSSRTRFAGSMLLHLWNQEVLQIKQKQPETNQQRLATSPKKNVAPIHTKKSANRK